MLMIYQCCRFRDYKISFSGRQKKLDMAKLIFFQYKLYKAKKYLKKLEMAKLIFLIKSSYKGQKIKYI